MNCVVDLHCLVFAAFCISLKAGANALYLYRDRTEGSHSVVYKRPQKSKDFIQRKTGAHIVEIVNSMWLSLSV